MKEPTSECYVIRDYEHFKNCNACLFCSKRIAHGCDTYNAYREMEKTEIRDKNIKELTEE